MKQPALVDPSRLCAWMLRSIDQPCWHVAPDATVRALNAAAEAVPRAEALALARSIGAPEGRRAPADGVSTLALSEDSGGGFIVLGAPRPRGPRAFLDEARTLWRLSPRELEVLALIREGLTSPQVARRLGIATGTARTHRQRLLDKSGCTNTAEMLGKLAARSERA